MNNSVTAIVPVYNVELYLEECLESILHQKMPFDEIILINDGSTDQSRKICTRYCEMYSEIKFISQINKGLGSTRNVGVSIANGDYVVFIDSDDYVSLDMNQKIKKYLCLYAVDVLYYNAFMQYDMSASEKSMIHSKEMDYEIMTGKDYLFKAFPESYSSSACLAAFRTDFLKNNNILFPEHTYFEDNLFSLKVALKAQNIYCIPNKLYIRRCRANSIMMGKVSVKKCIDMASVQHSLWKYLKEQRVDLNNIDFICRFTFSGMLYALGYISQASDVVVKSEQIKRLIYIFFEIWFSLFYVEKLSFNQIATFLVILSEIENWEEKEQTIFINKFWSSKEEFRLMCKKFRELLKIEILNKMKSISFHKKKFKVGVYGIGKHTHALLNLYRNLVGEIQCELYFLTTVKTNNRFLGCSVLTISECKGLVDEIVISSRIYQQEMKDNLMKEGIDENKVVLLYKQGDICDLITIDKFVN